MRRTALFFVVPVAALVALWVWGWLPRALATSQPGPFISPPSIAQQGQEEKPWIGILLANNNARLKERLSLSVETGVVIQRVVPDSPGAKVGLQEKDIITGLDGIPVKNASEVTRAVQQKKVGDKVTLTIMRGTEQKQIEVTLGAAPKPPALRGERVLPPLGLPGLLGGNLLERLSSGKLELVDKDGKLTTVELVAGMVQAASTNSLTVTPNGQTSPRTFTITDKTRIGAPGRKVEDLKQGDWVLVVSQNGTEASMVVGARPALRRGGQPFHRGFVWPGAASFSSEKDF